MWKKLGILPPKDSTSFLDAWNHAGALSTSSGEYDVIAVTEGPSDEGAAVALSIASEGKVQTTTMRAFTEGGFSGIVKKVSQAMTEGTPRTGSVHSPAANWKRRGTQGSNSLWNRRNAVIGLSFLAWWKWGRSHMGTPGALPHPPARDRASPRRVPCAWLTLNGADDDFVQGEGGELQRKNHGFCGCTGA